MRELTLNGRELTLNGLLQGASRADLPLQWTLQYTLVDEHQGVQRLVFRGRRDVALFGEVAEEGLDLGHPRGD